MTLVREDTTYRIKNVVFNAYVGRKSYEDPHELFQPIAGNRFDYRADTRFTIRFTQGDHVVMSVGGASVGEHDNLVVACVNGSVGDEWVVDLEYSKDDRFLYKIGLARNPDLVWTLNLATEPANQVHLEPRHPNNHRQLWQLEQIPYLSD